MSFLTNQLKGHNFYCSIPELSFDPQVLSCLRHLVANRDPFLSPYCTMDQIYALKINDHQLFFPQAYGTEVNYYPFLDPRADNLSDQGHIPLRARNSKQRI